MILFYKALILQHSEKTVTQIRRGYTWKIERNSIKMFCSQIRNFSRKSQAMKIT